MPYQVGKSLMARTWWHSFILSLFQDFPSSHLTKLKDIGAAFKVSIFSDLNYSHTHNKSILVQGFYYINKYWETIYLKYFVFYIYKTPHSIKIISLVFKLIPRSRCIPSSALHPPFTAVPPNSAHQQFRAMHPLVSSVLLAVTS